MEMTRSDYVRALPRPGIVPPQAAAVRAPGVVSYIAAGGPGHHDDHIRLFTAVADELGVSLRALPRSGGIAQRHGIWFYAMFDSSPAETARAILAAFGRALFGRKTLGLVFRPADCFVEGSFKASVRRTLFRMLARTRNVDILIIIPFPMAPEFSSVATHWIYDPQLWDLHYLGVPDHPNAEPLQAQIRALAGERHILVALGGMSRDKGFDFMVDLWMSSAPLRASHLFVAAGRVSHGSREAARRFQEAGGVLIDRHIDDGEMFGLYRIADQIWVCYAPVNDRSSGFHGRAVQFGIPVVIRKGSYLEVFGHALSYPSLALPFEDNDEAISLLLEAKPQRVDPDRTQSLVGQMRTYSVSVLAGALRV